MQGSRMTGTTPQLFDRHLLTQRKERAAAGAQACDFLLTRAADDIAERLSVVQRRFPRVLDLGAHHGVVGRRVAAVPGVETVISLESAAGLLAQCAEPRVLADEEALPLAPGSLDLVVSAHALHVVNDLPGVLIQIRRALKPDGLFIASFPGGRTLEELRSAWLVAESELLGGASPRVAPFADVRECGTLLQRAGFALPVADSETLTVTYASPFALMAEIKAMGMSNMLSERSRVPVTRALVARAAEIYSERYGLPGGRVRATFEIVSLTAWVPHESQQKPLAPGSAKVRLADVLGVKEHKA